VFADGFAGARKEPGLAEHRPAGIAVGRDGSIYITDDQRGRLWRVSHQGGAEVAAASVRPE
jgi:glucose/arabinose dehydrogenase